RLTYKQLLGLGDQHGRSPIVVIRTFIEYHRNPDVGTDTPPETVREVTDEARLFACAFASYYLRRVDRRIKRLKKVLRRVRRSPDSVDLDAIVDAFAKTNELLSKTYNLMRHWRTLIRSAEALQAEAFV